MTSAECRDYLDHLQHFGIKLGLENIAALCAALGNPQNRFLSIHVAGTNGKGSVSAMLAGIMRAHGLKTGLYTSPHLARIEERIRVNGTMISGAALPRASDGAQGRDRPRDGRGQARLPPDLLRGRDRPGLRRVRRARGRRGRARNGHGRAVRRDQRRPAPRLGHHHHRQGPREASRRDARQDRLRESGHHQAGRAGRLRGEGRGGPAGHPERIARERQAPLVEVFGPGRTLETRRTSDGYRFVYEGERGTTRSRPASPAATRAPTRPRPSPPPRSSRGSGGLSIRRRSSRPSGRRAGKAGSRRSGRGPLVLLDGAHNIEGVTALAAHIKEVIGRPVVLVFAAMEDKDLRAMTRILFPDRLDGRPDPRPLQALGDARRRCSPPPRPSRARSSSSPILAGPSTWPCL